MNFELFITRLDAIQRSISIITPVAMTVRRTYWGAPIADINDLPAIINAMAEPQRSIGMARRRESMYQVAVQLLATRAIPEHERNSRIATSFYFAAKSVFDSNPTIDGTVTHAVLRGANPTVPVILQHGGHAYIGFDAFLDIQHMEVF